MSQGGTHPALDKMCFVVHWPGVTWKKGMWCHIQQKNPPADRVLNWTGQFDVWGRTQTEHMEQGCVSPFT